MSRRRTQPLEFALQNRLSVYLNKLEQIWNEIGIPDKQIATRGETALGHLETLMGQMLKEECGLKERLERSLEDSLNEITQIRTELHLTDDDQLVSARGLLSKDRHVSTSFPKGSLLYKEREAKNVLSDLQTIAENRKKELAVVLGREKLLRMQLDIQTTLSKEQQENLTAKGINKIKEEIESLEITYKNRFYLFRKMREEVKSYVEIYGLELPDNKTQEWIRHDDPPFPLSTGNIDKMKLAKENLSMQANLRKLKKDSLKQKIKTLWDMLSIEDDKQELFSGKYFGLCVSDANLAALENELKDLGNLKQAKLSSVIDSCRKQLRNLQEEYFLCSDTNEKFLTLENKVSDEEKLAELQRMVAKTIEMGKRRIPVSTLLTEFNKCVERICLLEYSSSDKTRLKNRGGSLLTEEKERNQLHKKVIKLEKSIQEAQKVWKQENNNEDFFVNGKDLPSFMKNQWERLDKLRKATHIQQKAKRQRETIREMRYGSNNPNKILPKQKRMKKEISKNDSIHLTTWGQFCPGPIKSRVGATVKTTDELKIESKKQFKASRLRRSKSWSHLPLLSAHRADEIDKLKDYASCSVVFDEPTSSHARFYVGETSTLNKARSPNSTYFDSFSAQSNFSDSVQVTRRRNIAINTVSDEHEFNAMLATVVNTKPTARSSMKFSGKPSCTPEAIK